VLVVTLAHQGGWDEMAMVAVPLLLVTILLVMANRRASAELARQRTLEPTSGVDDQPDPA
jgi:ABC-type Fe3+ transport system permease subunit